MNLEKINPPVNFLDKINEAVAKIRPGSTKYLEAPTMEGCESLKDKIVVMVDDMPLILEAFVPGLTVATGGNASFIYNQGKDVDALVEQILKTNSNLVLMDYHLSESKDEDEDNDFLGTEVVKALRAKNFTGKIFGFSSDQAAVAAFERAGTTGTIKKDGGRPEKTIKELAAKLV